MARLDLCGRRVGGFLNWQLNAAQVFHVCTQLKNGVQKQTRHRPLIVAPDILSPDPTQEVRQKWAIGHAVSDFARNGHCS